MPDKETFQYIPTASLPIGDRFEVGGMLYSATTKTSRRFIVDDLADLIRQAKAAAKKRPTAEAKQAAIVLNVPIDVTPDDPDVAHVETPEEKAFRIWRAADTLAQMALRKVATGYAKADDADVVALVNDAKSLYLSEYLTK